MAGCRKAVPTLRRVVPITLAALIAFALLTTTGITDAAAAVFDPFLRAGGQGR